MLSRKSTLILASALFTTASFAAGPAAVAEPETPGSFAPQMVAEAIHNARVHGIDGRAPQPVAEAAGSAQSQELAERMRQKKDHGNINDSADRRMLREASRL